MDENSFCLMKNHTFIKESSTIDNNFISDGDNIFIIFIDTIKKFINCSELLFRFEILFGGKMHK